MFEYYAVLRLHYRLPVFPIVLYLRGGPHGRLAEYREDLFGQELLTFRYHSVALARLRAEEYVGTNPLGAALSALMTSAKQGDRAALMATMLERVTASGFNDALKYLLVDVIKTYFVLSDQDHEVSASFDEKGVSGRARGRANLGRQTLGKGREEGLERGREEGREAGVVEGKRKTLLRQLSAKFGRIPPRVTARAEAMSESELDSVLDRILTATTFRELGIEE